MLWFPPPKKNNIDLHVVSWFVPVVSLYTASQSDCDTSELTLLSNWFPAAEENNRAEAIFKFLNKYFPKIETKPWPHGIRRFRWPPILNPTDDRAQIAGSWQYSDQSLWQSSAQKLQSSLPSISLEGSKTRLFAWCRKVLDSWSPLPAWL